MVEEQEGIEQQIYINLPSMDEPLILEDILIETLAIDGICGVY